jgi:hypothetical protein
MQLPIIHLNGTGKDTLTREYFEALDKLNDAIEAFGAITVNGRDYYPAGPGAIQTALEQHLTAEQHLNATKAHLEAVLLHLTTL